MAAANQVQAADVNGITCSAARPPLAEAKLPLTGMILYAKENRRPRFRLKPISMVMNGPLSALMAVFTHLRQHSPSNVSSGVDVKVLDNR